MKITSYPLACTVKGCPRILQYSGNLDIFQETDADDFYVTTNGWTRSDSWEASKAEGWDGKLYCPFHEDHS